jgi:hypothetical protein
VSHGSPPLRHHVAPLRLPPGASDLTREPACLGRGWAWYAKLFGFTLHATSQVGCGTSYCSRIRENLLVFLE